MTMIVILMPIPVASLYCLLMHVPKEYCTLRHFLFVQEAILFINKGEILTDVFCLPYFQRKREIFGFC